VDLYSAFFLRNLKRAGKAKIDLWWVSSTSTLTHSARQLLCFQGP